MPADHSLNGLSFEQSLDAWVDAIADFQSSLEGGLAGGVNSAFWAGLIGAVNDVKGLKSVKYDGSLLNGMYDAFITAMKNGETSVTLENGASDTEVYGDANQGGGPPGPRETPRIKVYYMNGGDSWSYPGLGIHVNKNESDLTGYIQHEYGHYLQYLAHGSSLSWYNSNVAIPSAWSLLRGDSNYTHDRQSYELEATTLAHDFYKSNSVLNNYTFPSYYNSIPLDSKNITFY